ncbi:MAG: motility associated factor glycosyltransferase family protein [Rhabdochlamydiaceae bacterium]
MIEELIASRYPFLHLYLQTTDRLELPGKKKDITFQKNFHFDSSQDLDGFFIYGCGLGEYYKDVRSWLDKKPHRKLVLIEQDRECLEIFLKTSIAFDVIKHPQIYLHFIFDPQPKESIIEELAFTYPFDKFEVYFTDFYQEMEPHLKEDFSLSLSRRITVIHGAFQEALHYQEIVKNILPNYRFLLESFDPLNLKDKFKGIPALVCGAGPSLADSCDELHQLKDKAIIFAGGSSITALNHLGFEPHFCLAFDPNLTEKDRLKEAFSFETPFIYGNRLHPSIFQLFNHMWGYAKLHAEGPLEKWMIEQLGLNDENVGQDLTDEALSVTTIAVWLARYLGCYPIIFLGIDLAFTKNHSYSHGVLDDQRIDLRTLEKESKVGEKLLKLKDVYDQDIFSLTKWVMEADVISHISSQYPDCKFINLSKGGIGFKNIPHLSLKELLQHHSFIQKDIKGVIHREVLQAFPNGCLANDFIVQKLQSLKHSFPRVKKLLEKASLEIENNKNLYGGRLFLLEEELEAEPLYKIFLTQIPFLIEPMGPIDSFGLTKEEIDLSKKTKTYAVFAQIIGELELIFNQFIP